MTCTRCQREVALEGVRFCPFCAAPFSEDTERRKAIVVFADLSGFSTFSESVEPDLLRKLLDEIMRQFEKAVREEGGSVDKIIGDCIMFLFGVERSHADDHIRTIRTMDRLEKLLSEFNRKHKLSMTLHYGISFGTVSVGLVGTSRTVMGDNVNLAQRLLESASPGEVMVSEAFADLFRAGFRFEKLAPIQVKGKRAPVQAYRYAGKAEFSESLPPFTGRKEELARLRDWWEGAREGESVLLHGAPGIGKSRLIAAFLRELPGEVAVLSTRFEEVAESVDEPLRKLVRAAARADLGVTGFSDAIGERADFARWEAAVDQILDFLPSSRRVIFAIEDLHHAGPSALAWIGRLTRSVRGKPVFFLASSRTPVEGFGRTLSLEPLPPGEARELFGKLAPPNATPELADKCGGNPLLLREVARGIKEGVPAERLLSGRVELVLSATLDALSPETRDLIQMASVFGTRVPLTPLAAISQRKAEGIISDLATLKFFEAEENAEYVRFQHDLLRHAAYERIDLDKRRTWHEHAGDLLAEGGAVPEEVAYQYLESGHREKGLTFARKAAHRLSHLPRPEDARAWVERAEALARDLHEEESLLEVILLRMELHSRGSTIPELLAEFERVRGDPVWSDLSDVDSKLALAKAQILYDHGQTRQAWEVLEATKGKKSVAEEILRARLLVTNGLSDDAVRVAMGTLKREDLSDSEKGSLHNVLGVVARRDRETDTAKKHLKRALQFFENAGDVVFTERVLTNLAAVAYDEGDLATNREMMFRLCELALGTGDLVSLAQGLLGLGRSNFYLLNFEEALANYRRALEILREGQNADLTAEIHVALGAAFLYFGAFKEAEEEIARGGELLPAIRFRAQLYIEQGDPVRALKVLEENWARFETHSLERPLATLAKAEIHHACGETSKALQDIAEFAELTARQRISEISRLTYLRVRSRVNGRKRPEDREELRKELERSRRSSFERLRFELLLEALQYETDSQLKAESEALYEKIRTRVPEAYRVHFERKSQMGRKP